MRRPGGIAVLAALAPLFLSCSETGNLAEDETLYVGIKEVAYDKYLPPAGAGAEGEGVITAVAGAYDAVSSVLQGAGAQAPRQGLSKEEKDSAAALRRQDRGAYSLAKSEVEAALAKKPNNSLMGSSYYRFPLPVGLWIYNRYVHRGGRWAKWMFNNFAASPVYVSSVNPKLRAQVAQNTLRNYGYFHGEVSSRTLPQKHPKKAKVSYEVHPGDLFRLDTVEYAGFPQAADSLIRETEALALIRRGDPFSVPSLDAERARLSAAFRNNGFYYFQPSYITYSADTVARPLWVRLRAHPSTAMPPQAARQYFLGDTRIELYDNLDQELTDTVLVPRRNLSFIYRPGGKGRPPLKLRTIHRYLWYSKGFLYSQGRMEKIQSSLADVGVFSQLAIRYEPRDTTPECDTLDVVISARLDKHYDVEFTGNVATKSNSLVGPGATFSMARHNAFRGAETVSLDLKGSYEWLTGAGVRGNGQVMNSYEYGAALNLRFPRLTILTLGAPLNRKAKTATTYKIDATWMNRSGYFGRVTLGARIVYSYQRRPTVKHELVPFRLDYNILLNTTAQFDSITSRNQALYASMRDQFVPSMQYTLTMTSKATARNPRTFTLVMKEAGNVTSLIYRAAGHDFRRQGKSLFGVPFAQYAKLTAEFTDNFRLGATDTYLAARVFAGVIRSYGNAATAPYNDLFSIGGANSIRAFGARTIGPGGYNPGHSAYSYLDELGDVKLEANVEYRFPLISHLQGAMFVDAGNVWLMDKDDSHPRGNLSIKTFAGQIALGTGAGIRYDLDFLVVRFDVGVGIHAPYDTGRRGYYNMPRFGKSLGYHLAIGYPF